MWQRYTEVIAKLSLWTRNLSLYLREWHGHWLYHLPPVSPRGQATHLFEDGIIMAPNSAMGVTVVGKGEMPGGVSIILPNSMDTQPCGEVFHDA